LPGLAAEELRALVVRLIGRLLVLGSPDGNGPTTTPPRLPAAVRWVSSPSWSKCGWPWLGLALSGVQTNGLLLGAATEVLLGAGHTAPHRRLSSAEGELTPAEDGSGVVQPLAAHIGLPDEAASPFANPQLLVPLLHLCTNAPPHQQRGFVLNLSLWLRHSHGAAHTSIGHSAGAATPQGSSSSNQALLAAQPGWQLPICQMLNASGDDTDSTTYALCVRLLAEHLVSALRRSAAVAPAHPAAAEDGWAEVIRTLSFVETHTAEVSYDT
jgi:hypothetical protein